jgi:glutamate N-acetyltransferase/amino-acid N-acetyltransferase
MTTDTVPKTVYRTVMLGGKEVRMAGMAKGAGMIMPPMATMLAFVLTDAQISFTELHASLVGSVDKTFNRITIDGDTSTNDMVLVMANGGPATLIDEDAPQTADFPDTLRPAERTRPEDCRRGSDQDHYHSSAGQGE